MPSGEKQHGNASGVVAVVLAGGNSSDPLASAAGVSAKALVPFAGKPLGAHVLEALQASGVVTQTVLVGAGGGEFAGLYTANVPGGERLVDSLALGLGAALGLAAPHDRLLLVTADVPWLTPHGVGEFVAAAAGTGAALVYPIVREADAVAQFPGQRRTYATLADGRFTGGNVVLLEQHAVVKLLPLIDRAFRHRKNPFALAAIVGLPTLFALAFKRARLVNLEARIGALLGAKVAALVSADAALAADVDKPEHLEVGAGPVSLAALPLGREP